MLVRVRSGSRARFPGAATEAAFFAGRATR